jgi:transcriptional regulator with XRE-family HTH domain
LKKTDPDLKRVIGENIRRFRKREGLSQHELSIRSGIHRTEISLLERGLRNPRADTLIRISQSLKVTTDELLEGITWHPIQEAKGEYSYRDPVVSSSVGDERSS